MTKDIDLSQMTNSKEILPQFRDQLELEIRDTFLWAIGRSALTEMTKTVRERELSALPLHKLYSLFRLLFPISRKHLNVGKLSEKMKKFTSALRGIHQFRFSMWVPRRVMSSQSKLRCYI